MNRSAGGEDGAVPAVAPVTPDRIDHVTLTVEVDGERFAVTQGAEGDNGYIWLNGPNRGYGFGLSGPRNRSLEEHRRVIRSFLDQIDPETGYIAEE
jgi:hypothetical protein